MNSHKDFCTNPECSSCNPDICPYCSKPCELAPEMKIRGIVMDRCDDCYRVALAEYDLAQAIRVVEYNKKKYRKKRGKKNKDGK